MHVHTCIAAYIHMYICSLCGSFRTLCITGRPQLLHFPPYDKDQLVTILTSKVQSTVSGAVSFDEKAIQFCARKVSSVHGDLRKAVDICRRAAEIVEGKSDKGQ